MMCIKFIVLIFCFKEAVLHQLRYCDICTNHTLCKYKSPGPSNTCKGYDRNALLTKQDVEDLIERINNKRNFIALGNLKYLPGAANMKKLKWSHELATMAQRWADQCDSSLFPDKQDECRDTDYYKVGQNIATISGRAPGFNVKSFIDMWFIESLDYIGSVSYYNQSRDIKTNHFTQLIWADTDRVGCGKVRFYITSPRYIIIERLVCNFAPKGNVHGKPIYAIGYPSTQCAANFTADSVFTGLCSYTGPDKAEKKAQQSQPNLQDLYFRRSRLSNIVRKNQNNAYEDNDTHSKKDKQSQVMQNMKKSIVSVKRSQSDDPWPHPNISKNIERQHQEKGHSRVYNNHNHNFEFDSIHPSLNEDVRKYDALVSSAVPLLEEDYRSHEKKCTRYKGVECWDNNKSQCCNRAQYCETTKCLQCTRGLMKLLPCTTCSTLLNQCACRKQTYQCLPPIYQNLCGSNLLKSLVVSRNNQNNDVIKRNNITAGIDTSVVSKKMGGKADYEDYLGLQEEKSCLSKMYSTPNNVPSANINNFEPNYSERLRRETEDVNTKNPFWQMNAYHKQDQIQLKGLRYTTISNRKHKNKNHSKLSKSLVTPTTTEFITIAKGIPDSEKSLTEKYLSFDELLHLRKFNEDTNFRRQGETTTAAATTEVTTAKTETTSVYTTNTPFIQVKHCTRKLTCTWTANLLTDSAGHRINMNGSQNYNTPPGYVEGCTRTSTCTRDYINRNIMPSTIIDLAIPEDSSDDEEYCERRSLNKRDILKEVVLSKKSLKRKLKTDVTSFEPVTQQKPKIKNDLMKTNILDYMTSHRYARNGNNDRNIISYGDLYYYVVQKLVEPWQKKRTQFSNKKCACNNSDTNEYDINLFLFASVWYFTR